MVYSSHYFCQSVSLRFYATISSYSLNAVNLVDEYFFLTFGGVGK